MFKRVLVIEDDSDIAHLIQVHLKEAGCDVTVEPDGERGLALALRGSFDLIILDLTLPGLDGLDVCRRLRERPGYVPILMLTARSSEVDRILGLEIGADDYLTKPFSLRELVARVKALSRRVEAFKGGDLKERTQSISAGGLTIETDKRTVTVDGREVDLTAREFDLLVQFASNPGRVYTRSQLLDLVWGYGHDGYEHTVNSHINRLRTKVEEDPAKPRYILTVWGVGYKFFDPHSDEGRQGPV
jgi:DNA-binding response OmpR family regulator